MPVPVVGLRAASDAGGLSVSGQLVDSPFARSEVTKVRGSSSSIALQPAPVLPDTTLTSFPVMLPIKQPPPSKAQSSSGGTNILTAAEQFEMQAAFAYTVALAKQNPVPRGFFFAQPGETKCAATNRMAGAGP